MQQVETIWAIGLDDKIYHSSTAELEWHNIDGALVQIAVAGDGRLWGVNANDDIFTRPGVNGSWQHIDGKLINIAVGPNG
jgi:hypothetical protein